MKVSQYLMPGVTSFALMCFLSSVWVCPVAGQTPANQSTLVVYLRLKGGKLIIDRVRTKLEADGGFHSTVTFKDSKDKIEKELFDDLDRVFLAKPQFYWYALRTDADKLKELCHIGSIDEDPAADPKDRSTAKMWRNLSESNWSAFLSTCPDLATCQFGPALSDYLTGGGMAPSESPVAGVDDACNALGVSGFGQDIAAQTPLIFFGDNDDGSQNYAAETGRVKFFVGDPVTNWKDETRYKICFSGNCSSPCTTDETDPKVKAEVGRVRDSLAPLESQLWYPARIRSYLERYYTAQGFQPTVCVAGANEEPKWIVIQKSPRLGRILFPAAGVDDLLIQKVLYQLLSDQEFRVVLHNWSTIVKTGPPNFPSNNKGVRFVDIGAALNRSPNEGPFLDLNKFGQQQAELKEPLGFGVTLVPNGEPEHANDSYVDLAVLKMAEGGNAPSGNSNTAAEPPPTDISRTGVTNPIARKSESKSNFEEPRLFGAPLAAARKNYLGGGLDYKPGQGVRFFGTYRRTQLVPGDLSLQLGGNGEALGAVNYLVDYAFFGKLHKRLTLQFTGTSDVNANRVLEGHQIDERRTGGDARAEYELFHDWSGQMVRLSVELQRTTVALEEANKNPVKQNLSTFDLGAFYLLIGSTTGYARTAWVQPRLRFGLGLGRGEPTFKSFLTTGNLHQELKQSFAFDLSGRFQVSTTQTPIYEQASLGGASVVRGFREDDVIGRNLWSLQNELWAPIPGTSKATEGFGVFLQERVRLAALLDLAGIYQTTNSPPGIRIGPGVGLRIKYSPVILKLDWAYGLGDAVNGKGHGRFYFTVSTNRPF
jgi:Haemolysin secretion/activation protein ShlB/FhaC/HecB